MKTTRPLSAPGFRFSIRTDRVGKLKFINGDCDLANWANWEKELERMRRPEFRNWFANVLSGRIYSPTKPLIDLGEHNSLISRAVNIRMEALKKYKALGVKSVDGRPDHVRIREGCFGELSGIVYFGLDPDKWLSRIIKIASKGTRDPGYDFIYKALKWEWKFTGTALLIETPHTPFRADMIGLVRSAGQAYLFRIEGALSKADFDKYKYWNNSLIVPGYVVQIRDLLPIDRFK